MQRLEKYFASPVSYSGLSEAPVGTSTLEGGGLRMMLSSQGRNPADCLEGEGKKDKACQFITVPIWLWLELLVTVPSHPVTPRCAKTNDNTASRRQAQEFWM